MATLLSPGLPLNRKLLPQSSTIAAQPRTPKVLEVNGRTKDWRGLADWVVLLLDTPLLIGAFLTPLIQNKKTAHFNSNFHAQQQSSKPG